MDFSVAKRGIEQAFLSVGFVRKGKSLRRDGKGVTTLVGFERGFGEHLLISVGFWIDELGNGAPDRFEQTHLYFRLERIFPEFRETILSACAMQESEQESMHEELLGLIRGEINVTLLKLGDIEGLKNAMASHRLSNGLVRVEAREYLAK